jgi:hypothetical protein
MVPARARRDTDREFCPGWGDSNMMSLLEAIEASGVATWVRESPSLLAYTTVLSAHAIGLAIVAGLSAVVDLRLLGFAPGIPLAPLRKIFPVMYVGFWINAVSGGLLFAANATGLIENVMFFIKLAFVVAAVLLLRVLRQTAFSDASLAGGAVSKFGRRLALASLVCWCFAVVTGRLTSYPWLVETYFGI